MPEYIMEGKHEPEFRALDGFTAGYIEAMFFTSEAPQVTTEEWQASEDHAEGSIPGDVGFADLAPDALTGIIADCARFQAENEALLDEAYAISADGLSYTPERAGHDFWLNRNGHGCGFWSRSFEGDSDIGDRLAARCGWRTKFGEVDCYLGDDEKVYLM